LGLCDLGLLLLDTFVLPVLDHLVAQCFESRVVVPSVILLGFHLREVRCVRNHHDIEPADSDREATAFAFSYWALQAAQLPQSRDYKLHCLRKIVILTGPARVDARRLLRAHVRVTGVEKTGENVDKRTDEVRVDCPTVVGSAGGIAPVDRILSPSGLVELAGLLVLLPQLLDGGTFLLACGLFRLVLLDELRLIDGGAHALRDLIFGGAHRTASLGVADFALIRGFLVFEPFSGKGDQALLSLAGVYM